MPADLELWNKLNDFQLDDTQAALTFTDRLARENGWSKAFARRAADEYKKFVYLAATNDTPVTPSDVVDRVWHLHLTFTRSYWDSLCVGVLGHPLHHGPTKGGRREDTKYRSQYAETLALYRDEFGAEPPTDIWPNADARFAAAQHQRWVDARTHFVIRKPKIGAWLAGAPLAATGTTAAIAADGTSGGNPTAALVIGGIAATALLLLGMMSGGGRRNYKRRGRGDSATDASSSFIVTTGGSSGKSKGNGGEGGEGGEGGGGEGGGDGGGSGCGGGGGCGSS